MSSNKLAGVRPMFGIQRSGVMDRRKAPWGEKGKGGGLLGDKGWQEGNLGESEERDVASLWIKRGGR